MSRIRVVVTAEDIERGRRNSADRCPLARAIRRVTRARPVAVFAGPDDGYEAGEMGYPLPLKAEDFVHAFDSGRHLVQPVTFDLEGPDW